MINDAESAGSTESWEHIAENTIDLEPHDATIRVLSTADAVLKEGVSSIRSHRHDDSTQLSDLLEDARHDLASTRRRAERVLRDRHRRNTQ